MLEIPAQISNLQISSNKEISIEEFKGKYTYINFFASWNSNSLHEMEVINQFQENYEFVNYISVNLDYDFNSYKKVKCRKIIQIMARCLSL